MIAVMNRIPVRADYHQAFEKRFANRATLVDGMEGFISFQLLRPSKEGDPYVVMTFWETVEHFRAWTTSEQFRKGHSQPGQLPEEAFTGRSKVEVMEIIQQAPAGRVEEPLSAEAPLLQHATL